MDDFSERMLERLKRRQERLATLETTAKVDEPVTTIEPSLSSPSRCQRRTRLAELASRVDQWLEDDHDSKSNENISSEIEVSENKSTIKEQLEQSKPQLTNNRVQQLCQKQKLSDNKAPPQWQSPNLTAATLTVAQRRALFEQNVAQENKKPIKTTIVKISLAKTSPISTKTVTIAEEKKNESLMSSVTTPPRPILCSSSPPSRRGTRPRMSPAIAALGNSSPPKRQAWTPPCIKNVLLKKQLNKELEEEEEQNSSKNNIIQKVATSSPVDNSTVSPADRIAKSVGRVRFVSPTPSGSLYPDLSLIENSNDSSDIDIETNSMENQFTGCKRRSNGNNAWNSSTASSEPVTEDAENTEILGAKRSRSESNVENFDAAFSTVTNKAFTTESSTPILSAGTTTNSCNNSSIVYTASPLSLTSTSFTYYPNTDHPMSDKINETNSPIKENEPIVELQKTSRCDQIPLNAPFKNNNVEPELVHTVSIYRKQQQQLRLGGTPLSKLTTKSEQMDSNTDVSKQNILLQNNYNDSDDDEDSKLLELETVAERAWYLERTVVPEQDRIIDQATQALNICDVYRQRSGLRADLSSKFSDEHVHAERLLLIAGLRRTDAVREAQRLRVEHSLLPGGMTCKTNISGSGKTLVIESLRVPILSSANSNSNYKTKYNAIEGIEYQTRWPGGYRYFVCAIRAAATVCRPPITTGTRPADALEESLHRFSVDASCDNGIGDGYVEFITKRQNKNSCNRKHAVPTEAEGGPIMINGLNDDAWKVSVELYGLSPTATGDLESHNSKEHDTHENKSVLDKLWSTVKTPNKEFKKHHGPTASTCIESPGGPSAVRNTVFRQLGYFVFSNGQVDRQQFTLNKVHQSRDFANSMSGAKNETVRVRMRLLEEGEPYAYSGNEEINSNILNGSTAKKLLKMPSDCKLTEGFLTLFDDHELRSIPTIDRGHQWQRHSDIASGSSGGTTLWRRLWFRVEIIDDPQQQGMSNNSDNDTLKEHQQNNFRQLKTIVLRYWMYPEHAEGQRKPLGSINLGRCVPPLSEVETSSTISGLKHVPAAPAPPDLCARPNTLRLILYNSNTEYDDDHQALMNGVDDPLLLAADTADDRRQWCETINAAVTAINEHRKWIKLVESTCLKQEQQVKQNKQCQYLEQHSGTYSTTPSSSGKSIGKKKKLFK